MVHGAGLVRGARARGRAAAAPESRRAHARAQVQAPVAGGGVARAARRLRGGRPDRPQASACSWRAGDLVRVGPRTRSRSTVATYGLTHVALAVREPARSLRFYRAVFGMVAVHRSPRFIQAQTPGTRDVLVFETDRARAGRPGGVAHIDFRVTRPSEVAKAAGAIARAGGGYEIPTPVDPPRRTKRRTPRRSA
ncbi:MAG: VOC family protein [Candidatus Eisenbacteria bacterium]|uniref:VOC family protein n=1 Tax=Eiseniibacteriota bacterium TaxID=2212470 RepID=A0A538U4L4_UNCEI|nr:MAG: VOC family protein [Candidatus Eisenbacteria bacterium]